MRISKLCISPESTAASAPATTQQVDRLSPRLNVLFGFPVEGQSTLAELIGHLLYGRVPRGGSRALPSEGAVHVQSARGDYILRRLRDGRPQGRLTIVGEKGAQVSSRTIQSLLGQQDPRWLATIYTTDFKAAQRTDDFLLEKLVACLYGTVYEPGLNSGDSRSASGQSSVRRPLLSEDQRRRIDNLNRRRDQIVRQLEQHAVAGRSGNALLERQLREVNDALAERRRSRDHLQAELAQLDAHLTELDGRLRYASLATSVSRGGRRATLEPSAATAEIDPEIERCRGMLAELQQREATVRQQLSALRPDGAADAKASLASQRATLSAMETLVADLDAEISLLARSPATDHSATRESHARMRPSTELLRQHLYAMCGQITEQQRAAERGRLENELRQLARSQSDLSEQLGLALDRRAEIIHEQRLSWQAAPAIPQAPIDAFCQCESHQSFVRESTQRPERALHPAASESELTAERATLLRRRSEITEQVTDAESLLAAADDRWQRLQRKRSGAASRTSLDPLRDELARIEEEIDRALANESKPAGNQSRWRASDILAQLTDGRLVQIRTRPDGDATVIDRRGNVQHLSSLSPADYDLAYLAVVLALVAWQSEQGMTLPVILDEPFFRQDARSTTIMASLLHEFAAHDRQVFVFTKNDDARRRFESLGIDVRMSRPAPFDPPRQSKRVESTVAGFRVVRESPDERDRGLRVQGDFTPIDDADDSCYLDVDAPLGSFPVLGSETAKAFDAIGLTTVGELLEADAESTAAALGRADVSANTVRLWQTHMALMCFVPGVSLNDAQILAAAGVDSPQTLIELRLDALWDSVQEFLDSEVGSRFVSPSQPLTGDRLASWQHAARRNRARWPQALRRWTRRQTNPSGNAGSPASDAPRQRRDASTSHDSHRVRARRRQQPLRFLLSRDDDVADAPSIGPKTAERLAAVGIRSVADLLHADAESTASELDVRHVTADRFAAWQRQARLTCCIPELRGYGAQLLVACGFHEPQQVADANVDELVDKVQDFAKSSAGQRILRDGKTPSFDKIAQWVENAAHMRPLEAA